MGAIRQTPTGNWELTLRNKTLLGDKVRIFFTYDTEADARDDERLIEDAFKEGKLPKKVQLKLAALQTGTSRQASRNPDDESLSVILHAWLKHGHHAPTDEPVLELLRTEVGDKRLSELTYDWAEAWVATMKYEANYAPGTIRKRIASLSRCLDWWLRKHPAFKQGNPLKLLPRGASTYTAKDARVVLDQGGQAKQDTARERRLHPGELERIVEALNGKKRPDKERALALKEGLAFPTLFWVIYYTGMRLREAYLLEQTWIDLKRAVIRMKCSKQWYGREKWRDVPIRPELKEYLQAYLASLPVKEGWLFPFVETTSAADMARTTNRLSHRFKALFDYAGCADLTEHDLRHEATCQWYEMKDPAGHWLYRDVEIEKIMGWEPGSKMPSRYASFRAPDLAQRMYLTP